MKRLVKNALRRLGYDLVRYRLSQPLTGAEIESLTDLSEAERTIVARVKPFTLSSVERITALLNAVN